MIGKDIRPSAAHCCIARLEQIGDELGLAAAPIRCSTTMGAKRDQCRSQPWECERPSTCEQLHGRPMLSVGSSLVPLADCGRLVSHRGEES
eukprot:2638153-Amphidinium_carterae.1